MFSVRSSAALLPVHNRCDKQVPREPPTAEEGARLLSRPRQRLPFTGLSRCGTATAGGPGPAGASALAPTAQLPSTAQEADEGSAGLREHTAHCAGPAAPGAVHQRLPAGHAGRVPVPPASRAAAGQRAPPPQPLWPAVPAPPGRQQGACRPPQGSWLPLHDVPQAAHLTCPACRLCRTRCGTPRWGRSANTPLLRPISCGSPLAARPALRRLQRPRRRRHSLRRQPTHTSGAAAR